MEKNHCENQISGSVVDDNGRTRSSEKEAIMWPSERIPQGGFFHSPKIEYSKETADLLKALMAESKMSMMMRKKINYHLRNGEPLPKPEPPTINTKDPEAGALDILHRAHLAKRKSLEQILASDAYKLPPFRPRPTNRMPTEKEKKLLQEAMSGMRLAETSVKAKRKPRIRTDFQATEENIIDELLDQINERANWLAEMEELGDGKRFRNEVREQIAERLRHIKALETKIQIKKSGIRFVE
ncbi:UPF0193 protein EVG1 homolog isoform X1 [Zeugodacus cucurbitae]|uniref:UPF0193 protein EVG1 homolog isoform X1 n=1 Tax=Zeugodacus cucurbitae TaxID=28588 RepID=UPI00059692A6|nr:UPF0193 protein EVG1 homolog isoform X1 [Zeugodacus cucurbitae]XP_028896650.1 UPF0193 protein EVG1 homolog isoform X1 [Zeugodacus cucurbitae]